jgi:hypothetical protein
MKRMASEQFNNGKTTIRMEFSAPNQQWFVWRDDSGHVSQNQITHHDTLDDAIGEFNRRCDFLRKIGG